MSEDVLRVVAADSGAAILDFNFRPLFVVAAAAILVDSPYRKASFCLAEPIFSKVEEGPLLVIHELELCANLLKEVKADIVHLDMSLGGLSLEALSAIQLSGMRISGRARRHVLRILPRIRKIASDIGRIHNIEVLAMGKDSIPVRIAELTSGAHAVLYTAEKAVEETRKLRLGLPAKCHLNTFSGGVELHSLEPAEHDIVGRALDEKKIVKNVVFSEILNPRARGFRALEITPIV
ncbi:MAG: DUF4152 family protein [Candidatus Bathyarchaeota archaeon]|nr:MAG: DUF4152 family protein [Candidatus Bathyarchaeota archaeon]